MNIEIETQNNYQVIKLYGEVDLNNSRSIKLDIIKLIKSKNNIIVDFTHLQYIDSSGMASLVEA
ncbi:STAS domain-containing protein, partial [Psychrobacter sp. TB55-MNA-CIBAN-0194]